MKLIEFPEQTLVIAKDQPEYLPMPAHIDNTNGANNGIVTCCWQLTIRERFTLLFTGKLWHHIFTFGTNVQPQMLGTRTPSFYGRKLVQTTE